MLEIFTEGRCASGDSSGTTWPRRLPVTRENQTSGVVSYFYLFGAGTLPLRKPACLKDDLTAEMPAWGEGGEGPKAYPLCRFWLSHTYTHPPPNELCSHGSATVIISTTPKSANIRCFVMPCHAIPTILAVALAMSRTPLIGLSIPCRTAPHYSEH